MRTGNLAAVDRALTSTSAYMAPFGLEIAHRGEAVLERDPRVARREDGAIGNRLLEELRLILRRRDVACRSRCVCASISPGSIVAPERSITVAPAGGAPPGVTETMRSFSTTTSALAIGRSLLPSIRRPARIASRVGACAGSATTAISNT
jgi:hypothetical protein